MINLVFPYTTNNYREPLVKCMGTMEVLDIAPIVCLFQTCGTDVLFFQDKIYGPTMPYSNLGFAEEDGEIIPPEDGVIPTFITVFKTPFIEAAFHMLAETIDLEVIYKSKVLISSANNDSLYVNENVYNTISLYNKEGNLNVDMLCEMVYNLKPEDVELYTKELFWGNMLGYTLAPINVATSFDLVKRPIICNFEFADI